MEEYKKLLKSEIVEFRNNGYKFLNGELTVPEFKAKSGGMGVYAQKGGKTFMIRLKTPSGIITKNHMNLINDYVKKYNLDRIHITTRQAVQLHDLDLDSVCDIMDDAIGHDLFTRGGGGNYPRNVSVSPLSGVEKGEVFDVTPYALYTGEYFTNNATTYHLPRKLKVAFSNDAKDSACTTINDVGFMAVEKDGEAFFKLYLAGGLGAGPAISLEYPELVRPSEFLYYVEAMLRLFKEHGNYENKMKARTRFIPREMGEEEFIQTYREYVNTVKSTETFKEIEPIISTTDNWESEINDLNSVIAQRQKGLYSVLLHPECGQMTAADYNTVVEFVNRHEDANIEIRLSMNEDMYLRNLTKEMVYELHSLLPELMEQIDVLMSVSCVGVPTCQIGILQSQTLCRSITAAVKDTGINKNLLPRIYISGCPNSCARHQVTQLGFVGKKKKIGDSVEDVFELFIDGMVSKDKTNLGESLGVMLIKDIPTFIIELAKELEEKNVDYSEYIKGYKESLIYLASKYLA